VHNGGSATRDLRQTIWNLQNVTIAELSQHEKAESPYKTMYKDQFQGVLNRSQQKVPHSHLAQPSAQIDRKKQSDALTAEIKKAERAIKQRRKDCTQMHQQGLQIQQELERQVAF